MNEELKVIISAATEGFNSAVEDAKSKIGSFKEQVKAASSSADADIKKMGDGIGSAMKGIALGVAAAGAALVGIAANSLEAQAEVAKLNSAFEAAGGTAKQAETTYNDLYRVLGDSGVATEAAAHLAKITTNQQSLSEWTNICQGVYATFGDSLPIEGLAEAANETAKVGQVTGGLADALNWAGISEDAFNEKLAACTSESEREKLIRETLNATYSDAAAAYETNAAALLAQNEAQAKLDTAMTNLGTAMTPVLTMLTDLGANVLTAITPHLQSFAENYLPTIQTVLETIVTALGNAVTWLLEHQTLLGVIAGLIGGVVTAIGLYNAVAAVKAAMDAAEVATLGALITAQLAHAAATMVALAPYLLIVAAIAAVIAIIVLCVKHWDTIKEAGAKAWQWIKDAWAKAGEWFSGIWDKIKEVFAPVADVLSSYFDAAWAYIKLIWDAVSGYFKAVWESIKLIFSVVKNVLSGNWQEAWDGIKKIVDVWKDYFSKIWEGIKEVFAKVGEFFKTLFGGAWEGIKTAWSAVTSWFSGIWDGIKNVFSVVGTWFSDIFGKAWEGIKKAFSTVGSFFTGIWNNIKSIFSKAGTAIGDAIKGAVSSAVNKVLSFACNTINGFIKAINFAIGIINAIPGVNIKKLSTLSVPKMAEGGIVDTATLAVVGERGKEAVMPLENNLEWLDKLAGMLNDRMGGGAGPIIMQVDGKTFAQVSVKAINDLTKQQGKMPLVIA